MKTVRALLAAALLAAAVAAIAQTPPPPKPLTDAGLPTTRAVLERFVAAVGGTTVLERQRVRHYRGTIVQDLTWTDPPHQETPFLAEADAAGCVRYVESDAWADLPDSHAADLSAKLRWVLHPNFALRVEDFFPALMVTGRQVRDGRAVVVLAPRDLDPTYYALYFDEETGLLNHVGYHNDLQDWRAEGGVLYPHRWVFGRKGGHTTYVFEAVDSGPAPLD